MILNLNTDYTGQIGITPRTVKILCNDSFATITSANYLSGVQNQGINFFPTDIFWISYANYAFGIFIPTFSGAQITLNPSVEQGDVTLPVVSNHFAKFSGTTGTIADSGIAVTNVPTLTVPVVNGNIAKFSGTAGAMVDSGITASNIQLANNILARQYTWAGGATTQNFVLTGITSSSLVFATQASSANAAYVRSAVAITNTITVTWSADPGAVTLNLLVFLVSQ